MKCVLEIDIGHAREALECVNRYEMRTKTEMSHAREALKGNISIDSEVKTRIRYTSKALESTYHYGIQGENANSIYQQST